MSSAERPSGSLASWSAVITERESTEVTSIGGSALLVTLTAPRFCALAAEAERRQ